jgi:copper chaperone CopZ/predicted peroxiredoxin
MIMSKATSYVVVCVLSFLIGGFVFQFAKVGEAKTDQTKLDEVSKTSTEDKNVPPRSFDVEGMTCQGCVDTITSALKAIPGVRSAKVSLEDKKAVVEANESSVPSEKILAAIKTAGYKAKPASTEENMHVSTSPSNKQPILVNITRGKNELHAVSMAIGLAQSAIKDGRSATVFLNVEAPIFAAKDLSDDIKIADFPPIKKMLADFIGMGGRVLICGHCAHIVKLEQENMIDGAKVLAHNELFTTMTPGTVVFSY